MIGSKKLSTIREELHRALAATGEDPIRWLEERIAAAESQGKSPQSKSEVLQSLRRLLEELNKPPRQKRRAATKK